jgi:hypothetical protein
MSLILNSAVRSIFQQNSEKEILMEKHARRFGNYCIAACRPVTR